MRYYIVLTVMLFAGIVYSNYQSTTEFQAEYEAIAKESLLSAPAFSVDMLRSSITEIPSSANNETEALNEQSAEKNIATTEELSLVEVDNNEKLLTLSHSTVDVSQRKIALLFSNPVASWELFSALEWESNSEVSPFPGSVEMKSGGKLLVLSWSIPEPMEGVLVLRDLCTESGYCLDSARITLE